MDREWKIGLSTIGEDGYRDDKTLQSAKEAGVDVLEMSFAPASKLFQIGISRYAEQLRQAGLELWSVHIPFWPHDPAHPEEEQRKSSVHCIKGLLDEISKAGVKIAVLHAGLEEDYEATRRQRLEQCKRSLKELADYAKPLGVTLCVEDLPRDCIGNTIVELQELLAVDETLAVAFDTNHLLQDDPVAFVRAFGKKIKTLHVSDYDFVDERHWLPGEGKVDWPSLVAALRQVGYRGPWLYEIHRPPESTIQRERDLTFADFVANARACMNGQTPAPVGVPKRS